MAQQQKIGDWDPGYLLRFIRAALEGDPLATPSVLSVEDVVLKGKLDITDGQLVQRTGATNGMTFVYTNGIWKPT